MPLYEFRCLDCGGEFEVLLRSSETPSCPTCESANLERMLSLFAVNSAAQSQRTLAAAQRAYGKSKARQDRIRHGGEQIREHVQEDYGVDLGRGGEGAEGGGDGGNGERRGRS